MILGALVVTCALAFALYSARQRTRLAGLFGKGAR